VPACCGVRLLKFRRSPTVISFTRSAVRILEKKRRTERNETSLRSAGPLVSSTIQPVPEDISQWLEDRRSRGDPTVLVSFGSSAYLDDTQGRTFLRGLIDAGVHAIWPSRTTNRGFFEGNNVARSRPPLSVPEVCLSSEVTSFDLGIGCPRERARKRRAEQSGQQLCVEKVQQSRDGYKRLVTTRFCFP
jgi:hypothetical protein